MFWQESASLRRLRCAACRCSAFLIMTRLCDGQRTVDVYLLRCGDRRIASLHAFVPYGQKALRAHRDEKKCGGGCFCASDVCIFVFVCGSASAGLLLIPQQSADLLCAGFACDDAFAVCGLNVAFRDRFSHFCHYMADGRGLPERHGPGFGPSVPFGAFRI